MRVRVYACACLCMCVCVSMHMYVRMHVRMHVRMYALDCVPIRVSCMSIYAYVHLCVVYERESRTVL